MIFSLDIELWVYSFSFFKYFKVSLLYTNFKDVIHGLLLFLKGNQWSFILLFSLTVMCCFLSGCFQDFLFYLWFLAVGYDVLRFVLVLYITCLKFTEPEYENWFISSNLCETFRNYPTGHWNSVDFYVFVQFSPFIFRLKIFQYIFKMLFSTPLCF